MKYKLLLLLVSLGAWLAPARLVAQKLPLTPQQYREDFDFFWNTIRTDYCYFDKKQTDWNQVRTLYRPQLDTLSHRAAFVRLLEQALAELYDHHAGLGTNRADSRRLVPSGTDIWAEFVNGRALVQALRPGFGAEWAGVRPGMEITAVDGVPVEQAIQPFLGRALRQTDAAARNFALQQLLAGNHRHPRSWTLQAGGKVLAVRPDELAMKLENIHYPVRLEVRRLGTIGYIKVNNCLFDNALIAVFDSALTSLQGTAGLVLDLRETASGGNSTVARAIMGRFISQEGAYQRHELTAEGAQTGIRRSWLELVSPRGPRYAAPLVVLAGRWTGSMGEGLTIGFDALHRATVVGSAMAQLNGAIYSYTLPQSGIGFNIPVERLFHVDGRPRETYRPPVYVDPIPVPAQAAAADPVLEKALEILRRKK